MKLKTWLCLSVLIIGYGIQANALAQLPTHTNLPFNCKSTLHQTQKNGQLLLNTQQGSDLNLFVFHNTSSQTIWLNHPVKNASASAGWASSISADHWSALLLNKSNFVLSCTLMQSNGKITHLPCQKVLTICAVQGIKTGTNQQGSFWAVEDQPNLDALTNHLQARNMSWEK